MYNLIIGKYHIKYTPLKYNETEYPYCDSEGNLLKKVVESGIRTSYFLDDKGNKHDKAFRLINGKPLAKLDKTKEVTEFKEVNFNEVDDLLSEKEYFVDCDFLLSELQNTSKALKFVFTNGNGFKVYIAYIYVDSLYNCLFMKLGRTLKSEQLKLITQNLQDKRKIKQIETTIQGVDKAQVEDLLTI